MHAVYGWARQLFPGGARAQQSVDYRDRRRVSLLMASVLLLLYTLL